MSTKPIRAFAWRAFVGLYGVWSEVPWDIDRLFGFWVFGLGVVFKVWPDELARYGFEFLHPIMHIVCWFTMVFGMAQMVVGIRKMEWARPWVAGPCLGVFSVIMIQNASPSGHLSYAIGFISEASIILKRYNEQ